MTQQQCGCSLELPITTKSATFWWLFLGSCCAWILSTEAFSFPSSSRNQATELLLTPTELSFDQTFLDLSSSSLLASLSTTTPLLDAMGVDPGQALFWSTIVHWILWDKTSTRVALTFDAICIGITLWDGTVRASM
eukprot:CAMPEP_0116121940 /NCGR_PEP_ID=MMETSP0329-20121206/3956_1 /TAXON_ID=697910 /ORGANISM="Pseudo-nitzschia arenysensis, Strain B593" /LENGTH=135 /DNA_ID=CAMNT_0003615769 /DNA_START=85 /DNA_END=492 /DNA_ORIENTATION=-